jgi:exopolyphosphatase/guanosine-5'-triphosphate,3'-diphosphate pyrophosphatase
MANNPIILAGIDLGSNTFRLLVARYSAGHLEPLEKKLITVRLARGLTDGNFLRDESLIRALEALADFRKILDCYAVEHIRICGTEALRTAKNSATLLQKAQDIMGHQITNITGKEEAELTLHGALSAMKSTRPETMLLVDVGGGSTELILSAVSHATRACSLPVGAVSLTEQFFYGPRIKDEAVLKLQNSLLQSLQPTIDKLQLHGTKKNPMIWGCGGTATTMAALDLNLAQYNGDLVQGHILQPDSIKGLWEKLSMLSAIERNSIPGLEDGRGEILPAGIMIYRALLNLLGLKHMSVSDAGLLEGITISSISHPQTAA